MLILQYSLSLRGVRQRCPVLFRIGRNTLKWPQQLWRNVEGRGRRLSTCFIFISFSSHAAFERRVGGGEMTWWELRGGEAGCWFSFHHPHLPAGLSETQINTASTAIYKLCSGHNFTYYLTDSKVQQAWVCCMQRAAISAAFCPPPPPLPFIQLSLSTRGGGVLNHTGDVSCLKMNMLNLIRIFVCCAWVTLIIDFWLFTGEALSDMLFMSRYFPVLAPHNPVYVS